MKSIHQIKFFLFLLLFYFFFVVSFSCKKEDELNTPSGENPAEVLSNFSSADSILICSGDSADTMRLLNFFIYEDSLILRSISKNIVNFNDSLLHLLADRMYTTVKVAGGVGIAAPQVGILSKVILVKRYDKPGFPFETYINPEIIDYSDTLKLRPDGCLSIPGVSGNSYRYIWVEVEYYLLDGTKHKEKIIHEFTAHIFQHEIDHLNGIVFLDRM